jgi:hypothetical protein
MPKLTRLEAWLALAIPLALAGCSPEKPQVEAKPAPKAKIEPASTPKPEPQAKAAPTETKPAAVDAEEEAEIKTNLAKLDPDDRKLAEAQRFCAIDDEHRLGAMGKPLKLMIKDKPVFLCCGGCRKQALAEPDKTLAKVEELKQKTAAAKK